MRQDNRNFLRSGHNFHRDHTSYIGLLGQRRLQTRWRLFPQPWLPCWLQLLMLWLQCWCGIVDRLRLQQVSALWGLFPWLPPFLLLLRLPQRSLSHLAIIIRLRLLLCSATLRGS